MPKRQVKRVSWEIESEQLIIKPSMERRIKKGVIARSEKSLLELNQAATPDEIFYCLPSAAFAAYHLGKFAEAKVLALKAITSAESYEENWNHSNAIHAGHTVLGLLALSEGQIGKAIEELHASANIKGSPQLGSFGPTMQLAKELLKKGEKQHVIAYLHQCRSFWKIGDLWLGIWEKKIMRGLIPNFLMNLHM